MILSRLFYNVGSQWFYNFDSLQNKRALSTSSSFPVCFLLQSFILFSAASCLSPSFWLIILETVDYEQPNYWEISVWDTFSEASWMISSFWLSDKSLRLQLIVNRIKYDILAHGHSRDYDTMQEKNQIWLDLLWYYPGYDITHYNIKWVLRCREI